jgi:hypothetical protein
MSSTGGWHDALEASMIFSSLTGRLLTLLDALRHGYRPGVMASRPLGSRQLRIRGMPV